MKQAKLWLLSGLLVTACNNGGGKEIAAKDSPTDTVTTTLNTLKTADTTLSGCYSLISRRDTANLQLDVKGTTANGALSYNIYQKDRNDGSFQGDVSGNILKGWYLFRSEGMMSVREVSWKISGKHLWPGMGDMIQRNDTMLFAHPDQLHYDSSRVFVKVKCIL